jgi:hypothetical protein
VLSGFMDIIVISLQSRFLLSKHQPPFWLQLTHNFNEVVRIAKNYISITQSGIPPKKDGPFIIDHKEIKKEMAYFIVQKDMARNALNLCVVSVHFCSVYGIFLALIGNALA